MIEIIADTKDLEDLLRTLKVLPKGLEKATSRAINKTLTSTRAYMVKAVRQDYAVKAKDVRSELVIRRATWANQEGSIKGSGSPGIPLIGFARMRRVPSTKRLKSGGYAPKVGIPVLVRKDRGKGPARGVFLARMKSGHIGAFKRTGGLSKSGGQAIREAYGPSPVKMLSSDRYDEQIDDFADEALQKNLRHEADFVLKQMGLR